MKALFMAKYLRERQPDGSWLMVSMGPKKHETCSGRGSVRDLLCELAQGHGGLCKAYDPMHGEHVVFRGHP